MFGMTIGVREAAMMPFAKGICIGLLLIFAVLAAPWLWRFMKELIQQTKDAQSYLYEIMDDKRAGYFAAYLKDEMARQQIVGQMGADAYRKEQRNAKLKNYRVLIAAAAILLVLALLLHKWVLLAALELATDFGVIDSFSFACLAVSIILFLYYMCCKKRHRKKWKACLAIVVAGVLHLAARMLGVPAPIPVEVVIPVFAALGLFHYNKWSKGLQEMTEILQYRMQENRYADEPVVKDYLALQQLREQNGYKTGMMQHDDEVDELLIYLSWLEQSKTAPGTAEPVK